MKFTKIYFENSDPLTDDILLIRAITFVTPSNHICIITEEGRVSIDNKPLYSNWLEPRIFDDELVAAINHELKALKHWLPAPYKRSLE